MTIAYRKTALVVTLASSLTFLLGAQAFAATDVSVDGSEFGSDLDINDATNGADVLNVSVSGNTITITQSGPNGLASADAADCTVVTANARIDCLLQPVNPAPPANPFTPVAFVDLDLNNGNDSFTNQNLVAGVSVNDADATGDKTVSSGPGDDFTINTGSGNDVIDTGLGDNEVESGPGDDTVTGGPGEDDVDPGLGNDIVVTAGGRDDIDEEDGVADGADVLDGGEGNLDEIDYENGATGVTIAINGQPDDGHVGEGDNVVAMEELNGTDGNDLIAGTDAPDDVGAGDGDDQITTAGGDDFIGGDEGNDLIDAGDGGGDEVDGGSDANGADTLAGGPGGDELDYCCGRLPVSITPNGQPDDGHAGEGDNVSGFEGLMGGDGPDTLIGDGSSNELTGMKGNDLLVGSGGNDEFWGDDGRDGGEIEDAGDDMINALGGRDEVHCELGFDTLAADAEDEIDAGCERRGAEVASESARVNRKGKATVTVACGEEEGFACQGKLALLSNGKTIGKGKYKIDNGEDKNVTAKLSKKGRKALAGKGKLLVSAEARTEELPGVTTNADEVLLTRG